MGLRSLFPDLRTEAQKEADRRAEQSALQSGLKEQAKFENFAAERRSNSVNSTFSK